VYTLLNSTLHTDLPKTEKNIETAKLTAFELACTWPMARVSVKEFAYVTLTQLQVFSFHKTQRSLKQIVLR
jgi:hypothetical protein